jgi:hypothetical protein
LTRLAETSGLAEIPRQGPLVAIYQNVHHLMLAQDVKIRIASTVELGMQERMSSILAPTVWPDIKQPTFSGVICVEILQVFQLAIP